LEFKRFRAHIHHQQINLTGDQMSVLGIEIAHPTALSRLLSRLTFRPWQRRRPIDVRDLGAYLRRDIGIDD
jgi:hypothetical protein